jgi:hypothetical protein
MDAEVLLRNAAGWDEFSIFLFEIHEIHNPAQAQARIRHQVVIV